MSRPSDRAHVLLVAILAISTLAGCDKIDGRNRNRAGSRAFKDSNFVTAVGEYEKALTEVDDPTIHYNLALAYQKVIHPGAEKPVRLDAEGSFACTLIPGVKLGKADVCVKEGDTKYTDCSDLTLPAEAKQFLDNPVTRKVGEAFAKSDVAGALTEVRNIEKARVAAANAALPPPPPPPTPGSGSGSGAGSGSGSGSAAPLPPPPPPVDPVKEKADQELDKLLDKAQALIAGVCPSSYQCKSTNLCSLESVALADLSAKHYQVWLAANPSDEDTRKTLTGVWLDTNQFDKALDYWADRLKQKPDDVDVMGVLAGINGKAGRYLKAIEWYQKVSDIAKDDTSKIATETFIGNVAWSKLSKHDLEPDKTIELADLGAGALGKVISLAPNSPKAFGLMGAIYNFRAQASGSSIAWNIDRATARDLQLNSCVLNDEAKKANCACKVLQVGCPTPVTPPTPPAPTTPEKKPADSPRKDQPKK